MVSHALCTTNIAMDNISVTVELEATVTELMVIDRTCTLVGDLLAVTELEVFLPN